MNTPRPKKFESDIVIDGKPYTVGVNQPVHVKGYDVYQFSYDDQAGAASQYSVIEIVRDPGLPVVYLGIFMLLAGTLLHLGNGLGEKK
jgi:cytochrome c biogenesis protein ResB